MAMGKGYRSECMEVKGEVESVSESRSLDTTQALLEAAAREAEEKSEKLAEDMLSGDLGSALLLPPSSHIPSLPLQRWTSS